MFSRYLWEVYLRGTNVDRIPSVWKSFLCLPDQHSIEEIHSQHADCFVVIRKRYIYVGLKQIDSRQHEEVPCAYLVSIQ